jgi:molecular chaperone DnaK
LNEVILVGGQTRMALVVYKVQDFFGKAPRKGVHADEVVALGASIQGMVLSRTSEEAESTAEKDELLLLDVTPMSLGIATFGGFFTKIIERNTTIPTHASHIFTTAADNQTSVKILVLQGEADRAAENELLGEFMLSGIRKAKRGEPEIEVTFNIDADGIVSVSAKDLDTGQQQSITVTASSGLTEQEIQWMVDASKNYEVEIKTREEIEAACQKLEGLIVKLERAVQTQGANLSAVLKKETKRAIDYARRSIEFGDLPEIRKFTDDIPALIERVQSGE